MKCKVCGNPAQPVLSFENSVKTQTVSVTREASVDVPLVKIEVFHCDRCDFYQIRSIDFKHYEDEEYYLTTQISKAHREYQQWLMEQIKGVVRAPVAEIGPGDGYLGEMLQAEHDYTGYEPARKSFDECRRKGLNVVNDYFRATGSSFKTIISRQVLEHIEDLDGFLGQVGASLSADGTVIFEVPNIDKARKLNRVVDFCPEHLNYFTLSSLSLLLSSRGFQVEQVTKTYDDEYLLVIASRPARFRVPTKTLDFTNMVFWGAGSRGISLCNLFRATPDYFVDSDANKWGKYVPSTGIPIRSPEHFYGDAGCTSVVITAFFYYKEILAGLLEQGFRGDIYTINEEYELIKCN